MKDLTKVNKRAMTEEQLQETIQDWAEGLEFSSEESQFLNITVPANELHNLMSRLKSDPNTLFDYLFCQSGVDWEKTLSVVYHLESTTFRHQLVVKVHTEDRKKPVFDTVSDIWATAEFHEREIFDLFGITFNNHPNMKHLILTEDGWDGHPLRKDYVDELNMVIK